MSAIRGIRGFIFFLSVYLVVGFGCSDDDNGAGPTLPQGPTGLFPAQGATDVPVVSTLSWANSDTLAGRLHYDVYLGTTNPPPVYRSRLVDTSVVVGPLNINAEYYWKVVAYDLTGDSAGSQTRTFTTAPSFVFPTAVGDHWEYVHSLTVDFYDRAGDKSADTIIGGNIVEIAGIDTLADTAETVHFHMMWAVHDQDETADRYWLIRNDGAYLYAYENLWIGPPKISAPNDVYYEYKGIRSRSLEELFRSIRTGCVPSQKGPLSDTAFENPPVKELAYPLEVGRRWTYRDTDLGDEFDMEKEIVGFETITVVADTLQCYVIHWYWDMDNDGEWDTDIDGYDYISAAGTVKRIYHYPEIIITDEAGNPLGIAEGYETYDLLSFELHAPPTD